MCSLVAKFLPLQATLKKISETLSLRALVQYYTKIHDAVNTLVVKWNMDWKYRYYLQDNTDDY